MVLVGRGMCRVPQALAVRMFRIRTLFGLLPLVVATVLLYHAAHINWKPPSTAKPPWMEMKTCSPKTNIGFLKTHKCASSAIQNILLRYGDKHNLHFVMPDHSNYFGGGRLPFNAGMVLSSPLNKLTPNIFAMHTKWDHAEMKKIMPEDTVYLSIVREPTAVFESLFVYSQFEKKTQMTLEEYVRKVTVDSERLFRYQGYNQMTWDFGMPLEDMNNLTAVRELVRQRDEEFGLVLVAERMEESLVLLAKYLCWELTDVLVLKLNSRRDEFKETISEKTREVLRQKLAPDYLLYTHFLARFDQQVEVFGRGRMAAEVARLRELMSLLENTCNFVRKGATELRGRQKPYSNKVEGFEDKGGDGCGVYIHTELGYIDILRNRQRMEISKKFGLPLPPPGGAIPLRAMKINRKRNVNDIQKRRKTLPNEDKPREEDRKEVERKVYDYEAAGDRGGDLPKVL